MKVVMNVVLRKKNIMSDNFRFAVVMAMINMGYKGLLCSFRRLLQGKLNHPDKVAAPLAGFLSGLLSGFDDGERRKFMTILLLSRLTEALLGMVAERIRSNDEEDQSIRTKFSQG